MASPKTGTLALADLLEVRFLSPVKYGMDTIQEVLTRDLAVHNRLATDMISPLVEVSADLQRAYGTSGNLDMVKVDEFGRSRTQKIAPGSTVGFPMEMYQLALGWTAKFMKISTVRDMAVQQMAAKMGHVVRIRREIQRAIYLSSNYNFVDYLATKVTLGVKRFLNADGAPIPNGPNGEVFDGTTHTHYLAVNGITDTAAKSLVRTVLEHGHGGAIKVYINIADEASWRALSGFSPYIDSRLTLNQNANQPTTRLDTTRADDRPIGIYDAAEVWLKPWAIANYAFAFDAAPTAPKPVVCRTRDGQGLNLATAAQNAAYPLLAEYMEDEFGFGVWERSNGAVLYTAGASYTDPTIA